ncbi:MAG TPA: MFS transporter, partial [Actinomycetales bacterium]|nr:MFS transporter [Actinomycetales bacterium]
RLAFVLGLVLMGMWVWFLIPATPRGLVAVVLLNIGMAALTPMSNYGFDSVRENLDRRVLATGTGLSNMGGFVAAMIAAQGIGLLLDYSADGGTYDWGDFRFAWLALGAVWAAGFIGLLASRRAVRKSLEPMTTELK